MIETDQLVHEPARTAGVVPEVAIALSGGGYRAMLFHTGVLWRLGQWGFFSGRPLVRLDDAGHSVDVGPLARVSSVSGGSLVSAMLGLAYPNLRALAGTAFDDAFQNEVVTPVRRLAGITLAGKSALGAWQVIKNVFLPGSVNEHIARAYDRHLYRGKTLQDLPDDVRFVINASNLQSGALWRFSRPFMRDWRVGEVRNPRVPLAVAVGASSAFPPVLAPAELSLRETDYTPQSGDGLQHAPFTTHPTLADGGVYDNLGLETCFKRCMTLFVSNAGKPFEPLPSPSRNWASIGARCIDVMDNQVLAQRKRLLVDALRSQQRYGAFWDIQQDIAKHPCQPRLPCPPARTLQLATVDTDLARKASALQERLINWGYASADAAVRSWFNARYPAATDFPYPAAKV